MAKKQANDTGTNADVHENDGTLVALIMPVKGICLPEPEGKLHVNVNFNMEVMKFPSRFHRWMARLLLGWRYVKNE